MGAAEDRLLSLQRFAAQDTWREPTAPSGWSPGVQWDGQHGTVTTGPVNEIPTDWGPLLAARGLDPERYEVVGDTIRWCSWDGWRRDAEGQDAYSALQYSFKADIRLKITDRPDVDELYRLAADRGRLEDVAVADGLAQSFVELRLLRLNNWGTLSRLARGVSPGPESSVTKLLWTDMTQHLSERALEILGPDAPRVGKWSRQWLWSRAASIAGGTSEVQRTIIGDRMLGLPR